MIVDNTVPHNPSIEDWLSSNNLILELDGQDNYCNIVLKCSVYPDIYPYYKDQDGIKMKVGEWRMGSKELAILWFKRSHGGRTIKRFVGYKYPLFGLFRMKEFQNIQIPKFPFN
jgi:hypothetical protein